MGKYSEYLKGLWRPMLGLKDPPGFNCLNHNEAPFSPDYLNFPKINNLNLYPEPYYLYKKIAKYYNVSEEQLLLTCGSEQGLRYVFDTFLDYGDKVIHPFPTFGMIEVFEYYRKANVIKHIYDDKLTIDINNFSDTIDENTSLVYLANPDNPTGTAYSMEDISLILSKCSSNGVIFLLDEAYFYYYSLPTVELIKEYENLIIVRSFSKAWGLAGARVGFIIANKAIIQLIRKQKPMDELNSLSIDICMKVLEKPGIIEKNVKHVNKWKNIFRVAKSPLKKYIETEGNFIMIKSRECERDEEVLKRNGILPRTFNEPCLKHCIRFSVTYDTIMEKIFTLLFGYKASMQKLE